MSIKLISTINPRIKSLATIQPVASTSGKCIFSYNDQTYNFDPKTFNTNDTTRIECDLFLLLNNKC
jgi:hypothetical protein